jgi:hypothetical protein
MAQITLSGGATFTGGATLSSTPPPPAEFDLTDDTFNITTWGGDPNIGTVYAFTWGDSGNKFYVTDSTYNFREFNCSTPYDLNTTSYVQGNNRPAIDYSRGPRGMLFNSAGTRLIGQADWFFYTYNLSSAWDVSSISSLAAANNINSQQGGGVNAGTNYNGLDYDAAEDKVYSTAYANRDEVSAMSNSWQYLYYDSGSSLTLSSVAGFPGDQQGFAFNKDGTKFVTANRFGAALNIWNMTTAYDVTTASYGNALDLSSVGIAGNGVIDIVFSDDYTKLFLLNNTTVTMLSQ